MCTLRTPFAKATMKLSMFICRSKMRKMDAVITKNANVLVDIYLILLSTITILLLKENQPPVLRDQLHGVKVSENCFYLYEKKYVYDKWRQKLDYYRIFDLFQVLINFLYRYPVTNALALTMITRDVICPNAHSVCQQMIFVMPIGHYLMEIVIIILITVVATTYFDIFQVNALLRQEVRHKHRDIPGLLNTFQNHIDASF